MPGVITPPHVTTQTRTDDIRAQADYLRELGVMARQLTFLNATGGVDSGTRSLNIDGVWVTYVSNAVANTEDAVTHVLGGDGSSRIPQGFWVGIPDKAGIVYRSITIWTKTTIYLKCSVASLTVRLWLF